MPLDSQNHPIPVVLTLDVGTSSLRALLFDEHAHMVRGTEIQAKYDLRTFPDGGVEIDADLLFERACQAIDQILALASTRNLQIIAVASDQMVSNVLGVDANARAITPIYTYADTRPAQEVEYLRAHVDESATHQRVGTRFHTSYLPARLMWLARYKPELHARAPWWMSLAEYFYWRWLGQRACSISTASWTGLLNRQALTWDQQLVSALPISAEQLSPLVDYGTPLRGLRAEYAKRWEPLKDAMWFPALGDGASANIGSGCVDASRIALTIGTSSAMRVTIPARASGPLSIPEGLWSYRVDRNRELVGGALSEGGNLYAWMEETLRLAQADEVERQIAAQPPDGHGLTVLPFLAGERAPGWVADARAAILGIHLDTRPIDLLRAGLEGVAFRLDLIFELLRRVAPEAGQVIASGGALMHSPAWVQIIADVLGVPVVVSAETEATSRGTALMALYALGRVKALSELPAQLGHVHAPNARNHEIYTAAVKRQQKWYNSVIAETK